MDSRLGLLLQRHPARSRLIAWLLLPAVVCSYVWARLSTSPNADTIHVVLFTVPVALATLGAVLSWRASEQGTMGRYLWGGTAVAIGLLFAAAGYYAAYQLTVSMQGPPALSAFEVLNLAAAVVFIQILVFMTRIRLPTVSMRLQALATAGVFVVATHAAVYEVLCRPIAQASGYSEAQASLWAWYSTVGILLVFGSVAASLRNRRPSAPWRAQAILAIFGFGLFVFLWPTRFITPSSAHNNAADMAVSIGFMVGYFLFFTSSVYWLSARSRPSRLMHSIVPTAAGTRLSLVVTSFALVMVPALAIPFFRAEPGTFDRFFYFGALALTTLMIVVRTALSDIEAMGLRASAVVDPLTNVWNRRSFADEMGEAIDRAQGRDGTVSLAVIDVDDFARFNVVNGTDRGDAQLVAIARTLRAAAARDSLVARLGGDEFAMIFEGRSAPDAAACLPEVLRLAGAGAIGLESVTLSAGVSSWPKDGPGVEDVLNAADAALYWAKYQGKHRVEVYDETVADAIDANERARGFERKSRTDIVRALAAATDARDSATAYHSRQVAALAFLLAEEVGLGGGRASDVQMAALLHDIGKVAVPDSVLRKRSRLSSAEREILKEHAELGARMLGATELSYMAPWVLAHHERWDGTGYPEGIAGPAIPLEARIIAACDRYDQMVSGTPERGPLSRSAAIQELDQSMGRSLDPDVAEALIELVDRDRSIGWSEAWLS